MFNYESLWDLYEMKFIIIFLSIVVTIVLATWLYDKKKDKDNHD
jgi:hypothetical protein